VLEGERQRAVLAAQAATGASPAENG